MYVVAVAATFAMWSDASVDISSSDSLGSDDVLITSTAVLSILIIEELMFSSAAISFLMEIADVSQARFIFLESGTF